MKKKVRIDFRDVSTSIKEIGAINASRLRGGLCSFELVQLHRQVRRHMNAMVRRLEEKRLGLED